ncbi:MAG TPA: ribonuclease P protein component [Flavisolibacter sp.]|jgi:ribonuclease P protein component|nr:ribonuclease P protein component [Flavisolibacter sp.]
MPKEFGFPKTEHLKSRKQIDDLFAGGKSIVVFPVRAIYKFAPADEGNLLVGVSASKRSFKKAVDRNRVKRLLREAYRLQKKELVLAIKTAGLGCRVFFLYSDKAIADFETIKAAVGKCLQRLCKQIPREDAS